MKTDMRDEALKKWTQECEGNSVKVTPMMRCAYRDGWDDALASRPDAQADTRAADPAEELQGWSVTVERNGVRLLTIEKECVSGVENIGDFAPLVRDCAEHLLSFVGRDAQADERGALRPMAYHFHRFVDGKEMAEDVLIERASSIDDAIKEAVKCCPKRNMTVLVHAPAWVGTLHGGVLAARAAAPQAEEAQGVPEGWKLVPIVPTPEMLSAGGRHIPALHVWTGMIAAAPAPVSEPYPDREQATLCEDGGKCGIGGYCGQCEKVRAASEPERPSQDEANLCERIIHAVEGECDGLAITEEQASNILAYLQYGSPMDDVRRDAERYRKLRAADISAVHKGGVFAGLTPENVVINGDDLDIAVDLLIDAASTEQPSERGEQACPHGVDDGACKQCYGEAVSAPTLGEQHSDDVAVDAFASAMKAKMADARANGRSGWQCMSASDLSRMLREHVEKGDPRDVANFCMMLWMNCVPIAPAVAQPLAEIKAAYVDWELVERVRGAEEIDSEEAGMLGAMIDGQAREIAALRALIAKVGAT